MDMAKTRKMKASEKVKTKAEDQITASELQSVGSKESEISEQNISPKAKPASKTNLENVDVTVAKVRYKKSSEISSNIEEQVQVKRSCRNIRKSRQKKCIEPCLELSDDFEQTTSATTGDAELHVIEEVKTQRRTKSPSVIQDNESPTKTKEIAEDKDVKRLKSGRMSRKDGKDTTVQDSKSLNDKKFNKVSKGKKSPISENYGTENDSPNNSKKIRLESMSAKAKDSDLSVSKQTKCNSSIVSKIDKLLTKSIMIEKDVAANAPKQLYSRNRRKKCIEPCLELSDDSIASSVETSMCNSMTLETRKKTAESLSKMNQTASSPRRKKIKLKILFTGVADDASEKIVTKLGGQIVDNPKVCTHLVTDKFHRTVKMLCCIAQGIPVVETRWLQDSKSALSFIDPFQYLLKDKTAEKQYKFTLQNTLKKAGDAPLFQGWSMFATNNVKPPPDQMKDIILSAGGKYLNRIPARFSDKTVIISCPEDLKLCKHAAKSGIPVVGAEFLLTGVLRYENDIATNRLSVT